MDNAAAIQRAFNSFHTSVWSGGDGGIGVRLSDGRYVLLFGDTYQGAQDSTGGFAHDHASAMINNSAVVIDRSCLTALKGRRDGGEFIPGEPGGQHYWPIGAAASGSKLWVFSMQVVNASGGLGFRLTGTRVSAYTVPAQGNPVFAGTYRLPGDSPFDGAGKQKDIMWAGSVFSSGGYAYLYGTKPRPGARDNSVYLSRVPFNAVSTASAWRYWSNGAWTTNRAAATQLVDASNGPECNFDLQATKGGYVITSRTGAFGSGGTLSQWVAPSLTGPWRATAPAIAKLPIGVKNEFLYGGYLHPTLRLSSGKVLVCWSRNNLDNRVLMRNANYYMVQFAEVSQAVVH